MKVELSIRCDRCGSEDIEVIPPEPLKVEISLSELSKRAVPLIYRPTIYRCRRCGYEVRV